MILCDLLRVEKSREELRKIKIFWKILKKHLTIYNTCVIIYSGGEEMDEKEKVLLIVAIVNLTTAIVKLVDTFKKRGN